MSKTRINFAPIPARHGKGYVALSIYPPGTWFDNTKYKVFVGGSCVGERDTLALATKYLLASAIAYCDRIVADARSTANHYGVERDLLGDVGIVREEES